MLQPVHGGLHGLRAVGSSWVGVAAPAAASSPERQAIEYAISQVFGIGATELGRATRGEARVALARQVAMYLAHVGLGFSFTEVGRLFTRDRTTVAHACGVIEDRRDDPLFDRTLELLEYAVNALASTRRGWHGSSS